MVGTTLGMTKDYNTSSVPQKAAVQLSLEFIEEGINALEVDSVDIIADFGSSQGINSIYAMKSIIDYLRKTNKIVNEPLVVHNDLPTNDWTSLFNLLIEDNSYNGVASGRSFYEKCLPNNSLSIGYSSSSLHWLSKKPCNISGHCRVDLIRNPKEYQIFKQQSYLDYSEFLKHRSCELVSGGVLIFTILCINHQRTTGLEDLQELLYKCAQLLPFTPQELTDFTFPGYCRSYDECLDENLFNQYSFQLIKSKFVSVPSPHFQQWKKEEITFDEFVHLTTSFVRSWSESIIEQALINNGRTQADISGILKQFWNLYEE
ncbi:unnamed protein product, partial [Adineta steineri]